MWITFNQPRSTAVGSYGIGRMAPGIVGPGTHAYVAAHNQIRAHAYAYRAYEREFREQQQGKKILQNHPIGIIHVKACK